MSKRAATDTSSTSHSSSLAGDPSVLTPNSTPSDNPAKTSLSVLGLRGMQMEPVMDDKPKEATATSGDQAQEEHQPTTENAESQQVDDEAKKTNAPAKKKQQCHKPSHKKRKAVKSSDPKKSQKKTGSDDSDDSTSATAETGSESESDSSEGERSKVKKQKGKKGKKARGVKKTKKHVSSSDDSDEESSDESSSEEDLRKSAKKAKKAKKLASKKRKGKKVANDSETSETDSSESPSEDESTKRTKKASKKTKALVSSDDDSDATDDAKDKSDDLSGLQAQIDALKLKLAIKQKKSVASKKSKKSVDKTTSKSKSKSSKKHAPSEYKRVDQLWDSTIHNYKLKESAEDDETEFAEYAFLVRRCFNWENKYTDTVVDIKSKQLRAVLAEVMKECKSVSLEAEEPTIDPNLLFLYLEELRTFYRKTLKSRIAAEKKRKVIKKLEQQRALCKTLVGYIDEDYAETKKTLYPLLAAGNITFDLMWALFKPNEIAVTSCYGTWDEPRCFKVEYATKCQSMQRGEWYCVEGKYLEYDGKGFGYGDFEVDVDRFKGPRKISSLATYPLKYHRDAEGVRKKIIARGEQFVGMEGMQYQFHKGLAFMKKKKQIAKININGRIMVDPATFRRINPNYPISFIKPREAEDLFSDSDEDDECSCCADSDSDDQAIGKQEDLQNRDHSDDVPKYKYKWETGLDGCPIYIGVEVDSDGEPLRAQNISQLANRPTGHFTEEELLLTSPVVLGFAFSEKLWLEFSLSGIHPITYNEIAFDSLVLPPAQKSIVRALVESHRFHAAKTLDDVVQGKGKGLVAVLHGPPGTGKTLTAEGISELLKCPLYMVSAGELGTDPARLEHELQKILDIAHSWGAVLLLDEADVFLEKREVHDIHRNALVSIFLRLLEYFQGILFLTTNRVDTFDEAFQSRIHLPLRYGELSAKAKRRVWGMFLEMARGNSSSSSASSSSSSGEGQGGAGDEDGKVGKEVSGVRVADFSEEDLDVLARHQLNGRQIKNAVRTAQALALKEGQVLGMEQVKKVLEVSESFERDLKGGTGYMDAMRSYT
ncbi:P-loop containing nucleoside triphosphate hydrolase protein [Hortaea werneckii]|nr:P-loop containing nucleoside triphosphate hydrolase protein [Hortaea werneckii]KAI6987090.1 P-loop containing nucleoside triphosphate hydrolase protein [Hortaea werneckii]KAI7140778.1 P-loop containing nucleoside triphosphate hydrolase protein [Hortaea werneckii]KAI7167776.1 P-loop containing nucleoside triphosphate hydrolase protein [Hortaea werneckii]